MYYITYVKVYNVHEHARKRSQWSVKRSGKRERSIVQWMEHAAWPLIKYKLEVNRSLSS